MNVCMYVCMYSWVQLVPCQHQKLYALENIYFHMLPSIPLEIAHRDTSKSGATIEDWAIPSKVKNFKI